MNRPPYLLEARLIELWPPARWAKMTVLVACSGGADSTALLRAMHRIAPGGTTLHVAHYNHRLRGEASEADERFISQLAGLLGLRIHVCRTRGNSRRDEASLRARRYAFLLRRAEAIGARYVVTAHTADDQAETVLLNLCRGTGPLGLSGIRPFRPLAGDVVLSRPLLGVWKSDVHAYLTEIGQAWREDQSNSSADYTRNRIRSQVLPLLEVSVHPKAASNICAAAATVGELHDWAKMQADDFLERHGRFSRQACYVDSDSFALLSRPLAMLVLSGIWGRMGWPRRAMGRSEWDRAYLIASAAAKCVGSQSTANVFPGSIHVLCENGSAIFHRQAVTS